MTKRASEERKRRAARTQADIDRRLDDIDELITRYEAILIYLTRNEREPFTTNGAANVVRFQTTQTDQGANVMNG
jgi:hypothetical protein